MSLRTERIGEQLLRETARVLHDEVSDPRVANVTLLRVDVAPDLSNAYVYFSCFDPKTHADDSEVLADEIATVQSGLESASGFVRRRLAAAMELRRTPELRFRYDPSLRLGSETLELLRTLENGEETKSK